MSEEGAEQREQAQRRALAVKLQPAWSTQFTPEALQRLDPLQPIDNITQDWAWGGSTGEGVKVAVIDSGIDAAHPAVGRPVSGYVAISEGPGGMVYDTQPHEDVSGHGTACAGIIRSLAPDCDLYSVKVLGAGYTGSGKVLLAGLRWSIEQGFDVINMSL